MNRNFIFANSTQALPELMHQLLNNGSENGSRNGRVKELMHTGITLQQPWEREYTGSSRKCNLAAQIAETMWVLSGRDDVEWLGHYLPRAKDFSDDGQVWRGAYGPRLRAWPRRDHGDVVDQLAWVVDLLRDDHLTRRAVISIYDPDVDSADGKDIPCNNWLSFSSRLGKLDLHVAIRSNDAMWGWSGINAFEWSALQEIVAGLLGIQVGSLHFSVTSFHLYEQHWAKAERIAHDEIVSHFHPDSIRFDPKFRTLEYFDGLVAHWFFLEKILREEHGHPTIDEWIDDFPEPMLRSWLRILRWWWTSDMGHLNALDGTRLDLAARTGVQPKPKTAPVLPNAAEHVIGPASPLSENSDFINYVTDLHDEKHKAYGDSWKRRGEMLGIMANIARKVDRLGANGAGDTAADTAVDLLVYLAKYRWWLVDHMSQGYPIPGICIFPGVTTDSTSAPNALLRHVDLQYQRVWGRDDHATATPSELEAVLTNDFTELELAVVNDDRMMRVDWVDNMLADAYVLARQLWEAGR